MITACYAPQRLPGATSIHFGLSFDHFGLHWLDNSPKCPREPLCDNRAAIDMISRLVLSFFFTQATSKYRALRFFLGTLYRKTSQVKSHADSLSGISSSSSSESSVSAPSGNGKFFAEQYRRSIRLDPDRSSSSGSHSFSISSNPTHLTR